MSNTTQIFDCIENGLITAQNIRRGGKFRGKQLGRLSEDSAYASLGLYPVNGVKPSYNSATQVLNGPVHNWDAATNVVNLVYTVVDIDSDILAKQLQEGIEEATQKRLDAFARTKTYDSILSACTYATSAVDRLKAEGQYCVIARDNTWDSLYAILADVIAGNRPMPSGYGEIESELPVLAWPV